MKKNCVFFSLIFENVHFSMAFSWFSRQEASLEAPLEGSKVSSEHSSASRDPKGLPKVSPWALQGVPAGASGSLWNPLGASRGASGRAPKRIQKMDLRAPSFSWFLFTTFDLICLKRNMSGSQPASTAIQPASHSPASRPPRPRMPHRGESKGGGAAVCRREASSIDR